MKEEKSLKCCFLCSPCSSLTWGNPFAGVGITLLGPCYISSGAVSVTRKGKDVFFIFGYFWIPRMRLPTLSGSGRSFLLSENLSGALEIRATILQPERIGTHCTDCLMLKFCLTLHKPVGLPYGSKSKKKNGRGSVKKEFNYLLLFKKFECIRKSSLYLWEFGWKFSQKFSKPTFLSE